MVDKLAGTAKPWLKLLSDAEERDYHDVCDDIDKLYANLRKLKATRAERQYQIFWANEEVRRPSIYSRPPVPVATSRFRDRKPLPRKAADVLERALSADVDNDDLHDTMMLCRDDLSLSARGVPWLKIVERDGLEVPSASHVSRKDFRLDPARKWKEVGWVAKRAWLAKDEVEKRFGEIPEGMNFEDKPEDRSKDAKDKGVAKAPIWEIWHKGNRKVYWVSEGCKDVIDERDPPLDLTGFFPCPRPATATLQPNSLTPVPDFVYYRDQVEEINELTARIGGLQQALRVKGFYSGGNPEVGDSIESAMKRVDNKALLIPISSMAALGPSGMKDAIVWWPIEQVITTLQACIEVRKQLVQDVYEITGISDIMRGSTDANETLGAQELKSQYGSVRIQESQGEMIRLARDVIRMKAEVLCENVAIEDLLMMAQVDDIPTDADIQQQTQQIMMQAQMQGQQMLSQMQQMPPEQQQQVQQQIEQAAQQVQQQVTELQGQVTVEKLGALFRDQKLRPFVLDIETDSTIQPDETREKQKRVEFAQAIAPILQQGVAAMQMAPQLGTFVAESLRFMSSGFRPGRQMDEAIDELAEQFANYQPPPQEQSGEDPEAAKMTAQAAMMKAEADAQKAQADSQVAQAELPIKQQEAQDKSVETAAKVELLQAQTQKTLAEIGKVQSDMELQRYQAETGVAIEEKRLGLEDRKLGTEARLKERELGTNAELQRKKLATDEKKIGIDAQLGEKKIASDEKRADAKATPQRPKKARFKVIRNPQGAIEAFDREDVE
jgi:hypothetical protein